MEKTKQAKRARMRARAQRKRLITGLGWGLGALAVLLVVGLLAWNAFRPMEGVEVPIPAGFERHIPIGQPLDPYPSNPPAGGKHYPETFQAGFFDESEAATLPANPEGYLVHNLEHGYVIFWYNCAAVEGQDCSALKSQIQGVMDRFDGVKLIAFPWDSIDVPVVMTSWGRLLEMQEFSESAAERFIRNNRNKAPESFTP